MKSSDFNFLSPWWINKEVEEAEIIILKNRDGRIGTAYVSFEGRCTKFMNKKEEQPLIIEFEK